MTKHKNIYVLTTHNTTIYYTSRLTGDGRPWFHIAGFDPGESLGPRLLRHSHGYGDQLELVREVHQTSQLAVTSTVSSVNIINMSMVVLVVPVVEVDTARVEQRQEQREVRHCDIGQADDRVLVPHPVAGGTVTGPGVLQQPLQERAHAAQDEAVDGDAAVAADDGAVAVTVAAMETGHACKRERRGG